MFYRNAPNEQAIINTQEVTTPQKSTVSPPPSRHLQEFATSVIGSIFDILEWWETGES